MKIMYREPKNPNTIRLISTEKPVRIIDEGIVFWEGKHVYIAETGPLGEQDKIRLLSSCTIDLTKFETVDYGKKGKLLEKVVDLEMIEHLSGLIPTYPEEIGNPSNPSLEKCINGNLKEFFQWDFPNNLARDIDEALSCTDFTDIVNRSLWARATC